MGKQETKSFMGGKNQKLAGLQTENQNKKKSFSK